ncbi:MAG: SEC-C domain-containing protein [Spirochaetota bacterium]
MLMNNWYGPFSRGRKALAKHKTTVAIREFRLALQYCPVTAYKEMAHILFNLGIALDRSGQAGLAAKSWVNARKLVRSGPLAELSSRWINSYGMRKSGNPQLDDYRAFQSLQVYRYLSKRGSGKFCSDAERDVVYAVIDDAWKLISKSRILYSLSCSEKIALFKKAKLDFPYLYAEDVLQDDCEPIMGNFRRKNSGASPRLSGDDPCPCGSGLPYRQCCGRIYSCVELQG